MSARTRIKGPPNDVLAEFLVGLDAYGKALKDEMQQEHDAAGLPADLEDELDARLDEYADEVLGALRRNMDEGGTKPKTKKSNPNHDAQGRFSEGPGGGSGDGTWPQEDQGTATTGDEILVYRLGSEAGGLEGRNGGNLNAVASHILQSADNEQTETTFGNTITAYRVKLTADPGAYSQAGGRYGGTVGDESGAIGRKVNNWSNGEKGILYSFGGKGYEAEKLGSVPLKAVADRVKQEHGHDQLGVAGTLQIRDALRDEFKSVAKYNPFHDELGRFASGDASGTTISADIAEATGGGAIPETYTPAADDGSNDDGDMFPGYSSKEVTNIMEGRWPRDDSGIIAYHGTTSDVKDQVLKEGIKITDKRNYLEPGTLLYAGDRGQSVFVTHSAEVANAYGQNAAYNSGGDAVIFKVRIPKDEWSKFKWDGPGGADLGGWAAKGPVIKPEWIVGHAVKPYRGTARGPNARKAEGRITYVVLIVDGKTEKHNPNHDELGRFASGPGGETVGPSWAQPPSAEAWKKENGDIVAFHGTVNFVVKNILKEGLRASPNSRNFWDEDLSYYQGDRGQSIFVASTQSLAEHFATFGPGVGVVLEIRIPKDEWSKFKPDDKVTSDRGSASAYAPITIPPEWIVRVSGKVGDARWSKSPSLFKAGEYVTRYVVVFADPEKAEKYNPNHDERGRFAAAPSGDAPESSAADSGAVTLSQGGEGLKQYIGLIDNMHKGQPSVARMLLDHGRVFEVDDKSFIGGTPQQCYMNATMAVWADPSLTYVEGFVGVHGVPIAHAWTTDASGKVRDVTLGKDSRKMVTGYYGVPIQTEFLNKMLLKSKVYGILTGADNPRTIKTVLDADPAVSVAKV